MCVSVGPCCPLLAEIRPTMLTRGDPVTGAARRGTDSQCWGVDVSPVASQFYLLGTVLAPLRVALAFVVLFLLWPFALLQVLHRSEEELKEPLTDWRSSVSRSSVYLLSRLMFFLLGFMRIRVRGQRASRLEAPILVAAPHSTFFDPIILLPCDVPMVVSRTENLHVPVIGALLRFNQAIFVSRHDPASRKKVVEEVKRRATSQGKWPQVLFFPEGTCSNKKALLKFKPGAFIAGVPIQPILVRYPNSLVSVWLKVIWLTASQLCTTVEVEFLPVYQPSAEESVNPTLYASNVQRAMARALGVPATECELVGTLPVRAVGRLRVALEPRLWELDRALWVAGGPLPDGGAGTLGCQELARWLGLPHPEAPEGLCAYFQQVPGGRKGAGKGWGGERPRSGERKGIAPELGGGIASGLGGIAPGWRGEGNCSRGRGAGLPWGAWGRRIAPGCGELPQGWGRGGESPQGSGRGIAPGLREGRGIAPGFQEGNCPWGWGRGGELTQGVGNCPRGW
uniref:Lysophosphatidylcholine acyltransferase 4 n=1 Tax=Chelydra serpentina TaxID=8475 RepID=A0A8C3RSR8_CHESE